MKNSYLFIFLSSLFALAISHSVQIPLHFLRPVFLLCLFGSVLAWWFKKQTLSFIFIICSFGLLFAIYFNNFKTDHLKTTGLNLPAGEYIDLRGILIEYPILEEDSATIYLKTSLQHYNQKRHHHKFTVRIKVKGRLTGYYQGDQIDISCKLFKLNPVQNFSTSPTVDHSLYKKYQFTGYCKTSRLVKKIKNTGPLRYVIGKWRDIIRKRIGDFYRERTEQMPSIFLEAIILGDRGRMPKELKESLLNSGIYHLLAISGAHIGIITIFSLMLLKFLRIRLRTRYLISSCLLALFLLISGFHISAFRAVLMAQFFILGKWFHLKYSPYNIISLCGLIILFINPAQFLDPGYLLTFGLTFSIVIGREFFLNLFKKLPRYPREFLAANCSVSILSIPLSLQFFGRISLIGPLMNLFMIPITAVLTSLSFLLLLAAPLSGFLSNLIFHLLKVPFLVFFRILFWVHENFNASLYRPPPGWILLIICGLGFIFLTKFKSRRIRLLSFLTLFIALSFSIINLRTYHPQNLEFVFMNVGQGDSSIIIFENGDGLLVDGGGSYNSKFQFGKNLILPYILKKRIHIKYMSISHFHPDHVQGIIELIPILKPLEVWISSTAEDNPEYRLFKTIMNNHPQIKLVKVDATFSKTIGHSRITCLYPVLFLEKKTALNNHSQVLKIQNDQFSILLTGDIEEIIENQLIKHNGAALKCDVLKLAHHGSRTSSSNRFLNYTLPKIVLISTGKNNHFGLPHPEVIGRIREIGADIYNTSECGAVKITVSTEGKLIIKTGKKGF